MGDCRWMFKIGSVSVSEAFSVLALGTSELGYTAPRVMDHTARIVYPKWNSWVHCM